MEIAWIGAGAAILTLIIAYLQLCRTPKKSKEAKQKDTDKTPALKQILDNKSIIIGYFNYPPFIECFSDNSEPEGYYPSIFKEIAKKHNLNIQWKYVSIANSTEAILNKDVNIILSLFQTVRRVKVVDFCNLSHSVKVGGVAKKNLKGLTSLSDLVKSGLKIVVGKNEIGHEIVETTRISKNRLVIIDIEEVAKIVSFVETGQADIGILDSVSIRNFFGKYYTQKYETLKPIFQKSPLHMCLNGIMIPQNEHELANWIEQEVNIQRKVDYIEEMEKDFLEEYDNIIQRL